MEKNNYILLTRFNGDKSKEIPNEIFDEFVQFKDDYELDTPTEKRMFKLRNGKTTSGELYREEPVTEVGNLKLQGSDTKVTSALYKLIQGTPLADMMIATNENGIYSPKDILSKLAQIYQSFGHECKYIETKELKKGTSENLNIYLEFMQDLKWII